MRGELALSGRASVLVFGICVIQLCCCSALKAQGGPPFYTNDPGTPGDRNWEINLGYMPFLYNGQSTSHVPDVDINYGVGDRIQLTFENAWLRVKSGADAAKYGLGQDQLGVKWRFYDNDKAGLGISLFPQVSINNPNQSSEASRRAAPASYCPSNSRRNWAQSTSMGKPATTSFISARTAGLPALWLDTT